MQKLPHEIAWSSISLKKYRNWKNYAEISITPNLCNSHVFKSDRRQTYLSQVSLLSSPPLGSPWQRHSKESIFGGWTLINLLTGNVQSGIFTPGNTLGVRGHTPINAAILFFLILHSSKEKQRTIWKQHAVARRVFGCHFHRFSVFKPFYNGLWLARSSTI